MTAYVGKGERQASRWNRRWRRTLRLKAGRASHRRVPVAFLGVYPFGTKLDRAIKDISDLLMIDPRTEGVWETWLSLLPPRCSMSTLSQH
jgi:hypothetical protein